MARITYVRKAQQRYATVPVLDENGQPKRTPVMVTRQVRHEDGTVIKEQVQKTTKHGKPVTMRVTVSDKSKPLPNHKCDKCGVEIEVGQPYKHISPKSGPYGGRTMYRCAKCPSWNVWEYSNSLSAQIERITSEALGGFDADTSDADEVRSLLETAASEIRDLAEEKRASARNIEEGFGHSTSASDELNETADSLESWADEIEGTDVPDKPDEDKHSCDECNGTGYVLDNEGEETGDACTECNGDGEVFENEDEVENWASEAEEAMSVLDNCPV